MSNTIGSLEGYVRKIGKVNPSSDELLLYRGHANGTKYKLLPSILREQKYRESEESILRELVASHPIEFSLDKSTLEQLARVQHYSLPTRLLDATWNPLVALYFASNGDFDVSGEVIVFRVKKNIVKFFDSDTVSCVANLAHLKIQEKESIDFSLSTEDFNRQDAIDRLLQFIKAEKPHFRSKINPTDLPNVLCVKPKQNNRRIVAQSGAFLLFGITGELDTSPIDGISIERIKINKKNKSTILKELDRMSINVSTMFPEIEKAASYIAGKL